MSRPTLDLYPVYDETFEDHKLNEFPEELTWLNEFSHDEAKAITGREMIRNKHGWFRKY